MAAALHLFQGCFLASPSSSQLICVQVKPERSKAIKTPFIVVQNMVNAKDI